MSVRIDAKPAFETRIPPAWANQTADRNPPALIGRRACDRRIQIAKPPARPLASDTDPAMSALDRATGALIFVFVLYMAAQFLRAWLEGRL